MSRIGKLPISIPAGVTVNYDEASHVCTVKGPKGELSQWIDPSIKFNNADGHISFEIDENSPVNIKQKQAFHGLYRSLVNNMVVGVSAGYTKVLELVGVGYRVSNQGNIIEFALGYTHPIFARLRAFHIGADVNRKRYACISYFLNDLCPVIGKACIV